MIEVELGIGDEAGIADGPRVRIRSEDPRWQFRVLVEGEWVLVAPGPPEAMVWDWTALPQTPYEVMIDLDAGVARLRWVDPPAPVA